MSEPIAIPSMTPPCVHDYLTEVGVSWACRGWAVECGSWLGASCAALGRGLLAAGYEGAIHCYDQWRANESEARKALAQGCDVEAGDDLLPLFMWNMGQSGVDVVPHRVRIEDAEWDAGPIEVFVLDTAKRDPAWTHVVETFGPSWIPGVTTLALLDYHYWRKMELPRQPYYRVQEDFVQAHPESFTLLKDWPRRCSSAFFRYEGGLW